MRDTSKRAGSVGVGVGFFRARNKQNKQSQNGADAGWGKEDALTDETQETHETGWILWSPLSCCVSMGGQGTSRNIS